LLIYEYIPFVLVSNNDIIQIKINASKMKHHIQIRCLKKPVRTSRKRVNRNAMVALAQNSINKIMNGFKIIVFRFGIPEPDGS
jgi:hypothetical protein